MSPGPPPRKDGLGWLLLSLIDLAPAQAFGPNYVGDRREFPDEGLHDILLNEQHQPERHLPFFEWQETVANTAAEFAAQSRRRIAIFQIGAPLEGRAAEVHRSRQFPVNMTQVVRTCEPQGCPAETPGRIHQPPKLRRR